MAVILYVEDHPPAQLLMQAIVESMTAHQLIVASTGAEAHSLAAAHSVDLYVVDLDLPDTDGIALASVLKAIHAAPVLLVSAYGESVKYESLKTLIHAYLPKPLDPTYVAEIIERTLA
ncbi:MAG: response regulator [Chloroflexota bacterium]